MPWIGLGVLALGSPFAPMHLVGSVHAQSSPIPLECSLDQGPWQPCQMDVRAVGQQWSVVVGPRRFAFRHNGTGNVHMETEGRGFELSPQWAADHSLCWGSLCVRGEIPLD